MRPITRNVAKVDGDRAPLARRYVEIRRRTEALAAPLSAEDQTVQSMPDASPTKWHLRAHDLVLRDLPAAAASPGLPRRSIRPIDYLFNSYYEAVGPRHPRPQRGLLSRPGVAEIARLSRPCRRGDGAS